MVDDLCRKYFCAWRNMFTPGKGHIQNKNVMGMKDVMAWYKLLQEMVLFVKKVYDVD